ncbi:MAG: S-adenosylmethionine transporter [Thelocarpon impressellum]|nr:MAG: S-adenosylmethionine transporter [Thelocarpon impressellum]
MASSSTSRIESPYVRSLLAGAVAGTTVDLSLHPLDTLKTRLQSSAGFHASGGFRGIYKGIGSALVGSAPGGALFFVTYEGARAALKVGRLADEELAGHGPGGGTMGSSAEHVENMAAASLGEVAACAVRVPTEVVKQRAQAGQYPSSAAALQHILAQRQILGLAGLRRELYRGWTVTVMREVPFTMIQIPLWEAMKAWRSGRTKRPISAAESAAAGSLSGAAAAALTTPLDVLKTRLMLAPERQPVLTMVAQILRDSGPGTFFAGIGPRVAWISVGGAVFLGTYQWASNALIRAKNPV